MSAPASPHPGLASAALEAWDHAEPHVLRLLLKVVLNVACIAAAPFLALAFLFLLLQKPLLWPLIPGVLGGLVLLAGGVAYLVLRSKLRRLRAKVQAARDVESVFWAAGGR